MSQTTIHIGNTQLHCVDVTLPKLPAPPPLNWSPSLSMSFNYKPEPGRATRKLRLFLLRMTMSESAWQMVKFYHSIKSHQARKRLKAKRK